MKDASRKASLTFFDQYFKTNGCESEDLDDKLVQAKHDTQLGLSNTSNRPDRFIIHPPTEKRLLCEIKNIFLNEDILLQDELSSNLKLRLQNLPLAYDCALDIVSSYYVREEGEESKESKQVRLRPVKAKKDNRLVKDFVKKVENTLRKQTITEFPFHIESDEGYFLLTLTGINAFNNIFINSYTGNLVEMKMHAEILRSRLSEASKNFQDINEALTIPRMIVIFGKDINITMRDLQEACYGEISNSKKEYKFENGKSYWRYKLVDGFFKPKQNRSISAVVYSNRTQYYPPKATSFIVVHNNRFAKYPLDTSWFDREPNEQWVWSEDKTGGVPIRIK